MSDTVMLSVRIPSSLAKPLATLAGATDRTRTYVAARAIEEYVDSEEETLAEIREGLAQADAGETVSHADALRFVERLKGGARRRQKR
jgi:RHH-type transcriptional regulator, rel operon repressor / antitoxin RelB